MAFLLTVVMTATLAVPLYAFAEEKATKIYTGNGYEIKYEIKGSWTGNQNVEITLSNTGSDSLLNWALKYDAHGEINDLWNGAIYSSDSTKYIVKNAGYNYEVLPEQSVTFGYTLSGEYMEFPELIDLCTQRVSRNDEGYAVKLDVTSDWESGFNGTITVENIGNFPLEAWRLSFDTNFEINDIWNAQILSEFGGTYTICNDVTTTPIGVGESKSFGFRASKDIDTVPEISNCSATEVVVNDDFSTIEIPGFELAVSGFANYLEEENALNIFWYTNYENGTFELLESSDNENYIRTVILNNEYSYTYPIAIDFEKRYFKVIQTTEDGQSAESPAFYVEKSENGYATKFIDSDEDGLPDFVEEQIGIDINKPDTDDDGLTDYQEYYILGTDPLVYDSVQPGISDADADNDDDGLSNVREFELGTKPFNPDTDGDGLSDGDEVNTYGTDPLKYDTDDDGISDGDEAAMGTDPLSPYTNGVADSEHTFTQTINADDVILENINTAYNPYELSLEITAAGNAHTSLTVQESGYSDAMFNWSILGACPELIYDSTCKVDEVVVKFKVDDEYIENEGSEYAEENPEFVGIKRYNIFRFFEEDNILLPVKTEVDVDNNTLSATVTDLGTYCLIDMEMLLEDIAAGAETNNDDDSSDIEIVSGGQTTSMLGASSFGMLKLTAAASSKVKPALDYDDKFNVVFMYDTGAEGYSDFYNSVCDTTDFIFNKSPNANVYFIRLSEVSNELCYHACHEVAAAGYVEEDKYDYHDSFLRSRCFTNSDHHGSSKNIVISDALDFIANGIKDRNGEYTEVIDTSIPTICFDFFGDGAVYRESDGYKLIDQLSNNVFVSLIGNYDPDSYIGGYAFDLQKHTGGKYFNVNDNDSEFSMDQKLIRYIYGLSDSDEIEDINVTYPMILSTGLEYVELDAPISIDYVYAASIIEPTKFRKQFEGYADTDDDGLYDFEEINFSSSLIKTDSGRVELPTFGECIDYYGDKYFYVEEGLERFFNSAQSYLPSADAHRVLYNTKVLPIRSDPTYRDGDTDGFSDYEEIYSFETNPLVAEDKLKIDDVNYLTSSAGFNSEDFCSYYEDDDFGWLLQFGISFGNAAFGNKLNYDVIYESVLLTYLEELNRNAEQSYILDTLMKESSYSSKLWTVCDSIYGAKDPVKAAYYATQIKDYKSLLNSMISSSKYVSTSNLTNLINKYSSIVTDMESTIVGNNNVLQNTIKDFTVNGIKDGGAFSKINWISIISDSLTYLDMSLRIEAAGSAIYDNIYMLELVAKNANDISMRNAATKILFRFENDAFGTLITGVSDMATTIVGDLTFGMIHSVIASSGPIGLCVEIAMALGNVFFNISEQCEYAIRTYGAATISILLVNDFDDKIKGFDRNNNYYIISNNNNIRTYFAKLAYSRIYAEETYIKFREYAPGDSFNSERTYSEKVITYIKNNILGERNE